MGIAENIADLLSDRGLTLATAESLTGGQVGYRVTSVAGASRYYRGGVICYATEAKERVLGVSADLLARYGPVSYPVAVAMAANVRDMFSASVGLSTTGVAGPAEQDNHPVGTLFVGICSILGTRYVELLGPTGSRDMIRSWATSQALHLLADECEKIASEPTS